MNILAIETSCDETSCAILHACDEIPRSSNSKKLCFFEEDDAGIFAHSTGPAIALAALTTMAGFGTLMLASYRGIADLGFVMTVGVGANLLSSAVLLPVFIKWLRQKNIDLGGRHE